MNSDMDLINSVKNHPLITHLNDIPIPLRWDWVLFVCRQRPQRSVALRSCYIGWDGVGHIKEKDTVFPLSETHKKRGGN